MLRMLCLFALVWFSPTVLRSEEPLVFYHIPKCGGTSVASMIGQRYSTNEIFHKIIPKNRAYVIDGLGPLSIKGVHLLPVENIDFDTVKFIHGHITYTYENDPPGAKNFTFLRDPVERVLSAYRYSKNSVKLSFFDHYKQIGNLQVMRLSALPKGDPGFTLSDHLESAKQVLAEKFFFVGIVEEMKDSLDTLYKLLGWTPLTLTPKFNTTKKRGEDDPSLYSFVYQEEWADRELYAFGKQLFQQQKASVQSFVPPFEQFEPIDTVNFTVTDPLDGEGWGYRELDLETNTALRQSYVNDAYILFPLVQADYSLEFKATFPPIANGFKLLINGQEVKYKRVKNGKWKTYQAIIPKSLVSLDKTKITFQVSNLYVPSEHEAAQDHRKMGIGISEIHINRRS